MYFNQDSFKHNTPLELYVCRPNNRTAAPVIGYENDSMTLKLLDISELSFEVPEYIYLSQKKATILNPCFHYLSQYMRIKDSEGRIFRINAEPEIRETPDGRIKSVSADSLECELQDKDITALAVNMGNELSLEWYSENLNALGAPINYITFINDSEPRLSLMHILMEYAPNWKIGHIDTELRSMRRSFEIDASDLYAILTQDVARAFECVFLFDTAARTISAYKVENIGEDTHIYLSIHNLITNQVITPSSDNIYTQFSVLADDGKDILPFANFGSHRISNYDYFLNPIWFDETTITKYNAYKTNVDAKRNRYMELTKSWNYLNSQVTELYDRVPDSRCEAAWTDLTSEQLDAELESYQAAAALLRELHTVDGVLQIEGSSDYGIYVSLTEVIIPKLMAQIEAVNSGKPKPDEEVSWKTNWDLYGINELNHLLLTYTDAVTLYSAYTQPYDSGVHSENEALYKLNHQLYLENTEYVRQIQAAIGARKSRVAELQAEMEKLQTERKHLIAYAQMTHPEHGFTSEELKTFESLTVHTDYENENILVTDFDDAIAQVDLAEELYNAACEQLAIESRPQLSMRIDLDSFLSITRYNGFTDELAVGNFIRVGANSDESEKLRIVSIQFQPSDLSARLNLEFSNMVTTYNRRDDYTYLTGNSYSRSGKNKITAGISSEDLTTALSTLLNSKFASFTSSPVFQNATAQNIQAVLGAFDVALADYLKTKDLSAEVADISKLSADSAFITYLQTQFASLTELDAAKIDVEELIADYAEIKLLLSGSTTTGSLHTIYLNAQNSVIDTAYIKDLMAQNITVNDLKAGNINTDYIGLASDDGALSINGATMQFSDTSGVRLQLGKDADGNFSFILRGSEQSVLIDEKGLHEDAITDGLIKTRMVDDNAIDTTKVDWTSAGASEENGKPVWKSTNITVNEDGTTLTEKINTIQTAIDTNALEITQLISDTTITKADGTTVSVKDDYNRTKDTVDSHAQILSSHESSISGVTSKTNTLEQDLNSTKNNISSITTNLEGDISSLEERTGTLELGLDNFKIGVESHLEETNENAAILANMAAGEMLYGNPTFALENPEGFLPEHFSEYFPGISLYKCDHTAVTVTANTATPIEDSLAHSISFSASEWNTETEQFIGGFCFHTASRCNGRYVCKIIAKIPADYSLECLETTAGASCDARWIGETKTYGDISGKNIGTGRWAEYDFYVGCGDTGDFGEMFHFCLTSSSSAPSEAYPVTWELCFATVYDITNTFSYARKLNHMEASIKAQGDRIDQVISNTMVTVTDVDDNGTATEKVIDVKEMYNRMNSSLEGTTTQIGEISKTVEKNTENVVALQGQMISIETTVNGINTTITNIPESIDERVQATIANYEMTSEAWMAKFKEALNAPDENGEIVGTTVGEVTISSKGIQFDKGPKRSVFNTDEINVYENENRVFGIQEDSVYTNRLLAPNGADFYGIKAVPMQISEDTKFLCFVPSGGDS